MYGKIVIIITMKSIAVIFGGRSTEHDVSIVTAIGSIIKPLRSLGGYDIHPVYIAKNGAWYCDQKLANIDLYSSGSITNFIRGSKPITLQFGDGLSLVKTTGLTGRKITKKIDIVFPAMHGTHGEDGELMGLLEMAGVPYVGCDMVSSAIAMDKVLAKQIVEADSVPVSKYIDLRRDTYNQKSKAIIEEITKTLTYPMFIKPAHLGSSIGIGRATNDKELENAIEVATYYDEKVIVEEEVQNLIEVTLPIIGNEELQVALLERPLINVDEFFDFETKYMHGGKKGTAKTGVKNGARGYSELPAKIDKKLYDKAILTAKRAYRILGCSGIARIDMLIDQKTGTVYFNEANPLPGSLYQHNWRAAGVSPADLVQKLIHLAEERHAKKAINETSFATNFLKQF